jgi:hypothetical protein
MRVCAAIMLSGLIIAPAPVRAEGTWVVIPGRPDVPVIVNPYGLDASYTVVEGDFGLDRPAQVNPQIIAGPRVLPAPVRFKHYFPGYGDTPGYGRLEVEPPPNRKLPAPAQSYSRSWSTQSDPLPASTDPPYPISVDAYTGPWGPPGPPGPRGPRGPKGPKPKPLKPGGH